MVKCRLVIVLSLTPLWRSNAGPSIRKTFVGLELRGGSNSPYELNPNYQEQKNFRHAPARPLTLGDLERKPPPPPQNELFVDSGGCKTQRKKSGSSSPSGVLRKYFTRLHRDSPMLSLGTIACCVVFCLWQVKDFHKLLQQHFVCSRMNVIQHKRYSALFLSAISHASLSHLLMNLWAFCSFGPKVKRILASPWGSGQSWELWPLVLGSALAGSLSYMWLSGSGGGGCMGLSAVTLSFISIFAQAYPDSELCFVAGVIPIRLPAKIVLAISFVFSILGSYAGIQDGVAHSAHLGGLVFGMGYYELWKRRHDIQIMKRKLKRKLSRTRSK